MFFADFFENIVQQAYANSLQGNLIASTAQSGRQLDPSYLPLLANETMPAKYSTGGPLINEPTNSLPEVLFFTYKLNNIFFMNK